MRRALLLAAITTAADAYAWRARLGLGGSVCPLTCPIASTSVIVVEDLGPPGFTTRQRSIAEAASLAAQLCARLVLPVTPCDAFSGRTTDDCRLKWSELYELRSATGASVIVERKEVVDATNATRLESAFPQNRRRLSKARVAAAEATLQALRRAREIRDGGGRFFWRIDHWREWRVGKLSLKSEARKLKLAWPSDDPPPLAPPPCVLGLAQNAAKVVRKVADSAGPFDATTIQRGSDCDTHPKRDVGEFLACVEELLLAAWKSNLLDGVEVHNARCPHRLLAPSVLVATDTTRKGYIRDVQGLKQLRSKHLIDVAALVSEAIEDDATYLNHQKLLAPVVEEQLPGLSETRLDMSKKACRMIETRWAERLPKDAQQAIKERVTKCGVAATPSSAGTCPQECQQASPHSLVVVHNLGRAGFADRQFIIEGLAIMAGSLCARLVLPIPWKSFGGHNLPIGDLYEEPPKHLQWTDLFELRSATGAPMLVNKNAISGAMNASAVAFSSAENFTRYNASDHVTMTVGLRRAKAARDAGDTFVWRIKGSFWHWHKSLIKEARRLNLHWKEYGAKGPLGEAYGPLPLSPPPCVLGVASHISKVVRKASELAGGSFDALHIRRGDALMECGTNLHRHVKPFLSCVAPLLRASTILIFTDEHHKTYLQHLYALKTLRDARDGDALVQEAFDAVTRGSSVYAPYRSLVDGYVGRQLQGLADTRLEMRRYLCRLSVLGRWASFLPSDEKTYVTDLATSCRGGNATRAATPRPTASPVQHTERDQRSASVPMPPLLMRLINNLWS